jgi:two-component system NarL family sensor kinase
MVVNRLVTVFALILTGILSDRNRDIQNTLLEQQARLQAQDKLMNMREDFASEREH